MQHISAHVQTHCGHLCVFRHFIGLQSDESKPLHPVSEKTVHTNFLHDVKQQGRLVEKKM